MPRRSKANDLSEEARPMATEAERVPTGDNESAIPDQPPQPTAAEPESLDAEIERRIVEDSQSAAPDRVPQPPLAQPVPAVPAPLTFDTELDDAALAAAVFVPPLD